MTFLSSETSGTSHTRHHEKSQGIPSHTAPGSPWETPAVTARLIPNPQHGTTMGSWGLSLLQLSLEVEVCENNVKTCGDKAPSRELAPVLPFLCWVQLCPFKSNGLFWWGGEKLKVCHRGRFGVYGGSGSTRQRRDSSGVSWTQQGFIKPGFQFWCSSGA